MELNGNIWMQLLDYFKNYSSDYLFAAREHIHISLLALLLAVLIGVVSGILCVKYKKTERWIVPLFQALRIVPSLAILFLLIPVMGTGVQPALIALVILAVPAVLMNTVAGIEDVPFSVMETAYGIGMSDRQAFWRVRLPLAAPMILTGIKTAMIEIIASATLASKIGAGGFGDIIFTGLGLNRVDLLLIGGISVAVLSIAAGWLLDRADTFLFKYKFVGR